MGFSDYRGPLCHMTDLFTAERNTWEMAESFCVSLIITVIIFIIIIIVQSWFLSVTTEMDSPF